MIEDKVFDGLGDNLFEVENQIKNIISQQSENLNVL